MNTRTVSLKTAALTLVLAAAALAAGPAMVCFKVACATERIEKIEGTAARLTVSVATAGGGAKNFDQTHVFPKSSTTAAISGHFRNALIAAGFTEGTDFTLSDNCLTFPNANSVDGGTQDVSQIVMTFQAVDGVTVTKTPPFKKIELDDQKSHAVQPGSGRMIIAGYGLTFDAGGNPGPIITRALSLELEAGATPAQVMTSFADGFAQAGWTAVLETPTRLRIEEMPGGIAVASLSVTPLTHDQVFAGPAGEPDDGQPPSGDENHFRVSRDGGS